jgi:hypothetical protein
MVANSIELDTNHPRFDLAMEMLCTIPRKPEYVSLSAVAEDLGLPDSYDMMEMVRQLQRRHFGVRVGDRSGSDRVDHPRRRRSLSNGRSKILG